MAQLELTRQTAAGTQERIYSLDAARGFLMSLGVLLHAANIYAPGTWLVNDVDRHWLFGALSSAIHVFRMPAFFWVAGYFCAMTLTQGGPSKLLESRLPRLVVPLIATLLTVNLAQESLIAATSGRNLSAVLSEGIPLGHLWFLVNLLAYTILAALISSVGVGRMGQAQPARRASPLGFFVSVALISYVLDLFVRATGLAYVNLAGITSPYQLARYVPYFAFGVLMFLHPDLRKAFLKQPPWLFLPAVGCALAIEPMSRGTTVWLTEAAQLLCIALTWLSVGSLLSLFYTHCQRRTRLSEVVSKASYTIYLFHQVIVVALGLLLVRVSLNPVLEFGLIVAVTLAATVCIHYGAIERLSVLKLAFNGRVASEHGSAQGRTAPGKGASQPASPGARRYGMSTSPAGQPIDG